MINQDEFRFRLGFEWRSMISLYPRIYAAWTGLRLPSKALGINKLTTDLVIEGYPRSGNTFAWYAFTMTQTLPTNISHHAHNAALIVEAVKNKIPTLVLIRDPEDCVISYCIFEPRLSLKLGLKHWIRYYSKIKQFKYGYTLASFDSIVTDFGKVISKVNEKFGTQFELFDHNDDNVRFVFSNMALRANQLAQRGILNNNLENWISRPSYNREQKKEMLQSEIQKDKNLVSLLQNAQVIYNTILDNE